MQINITDEVIEQMVNKSVRKRIKEIQGDYTSKAFIENIIYKVVLDKIWEICPSVESYIHEEVKKCVNLSLENENGLTKKELVEDIVNNLLESLLNQY